MLLDLTNPAVTARLAAAGLDLGEADYFGTGVSARWLQDWLSKRGSIDLISDAGGFTAWFQCGDRFIRASARTKSDTLAELVLAILKESGDGTSK